MAKGTVRNVAVRGIICTVPGDPISIASIGRSFPPEEIERLSATVGLKKVHRTTPGQTAGDLCAAAAERLLSDLGWEKGSVDALILVTQTPDHFLPATACLVHGRLGMADTCLAFDVSMGCSGYIYGLYLASQMINGGLKRVLLLAGDTISKVVSPEDRSVSMLFGDAGSATALENDPTAEPISFVLGSDGTGAPNLMIQAGGFRERPTPISFERVEDEQGNRRTPMDVYMDGLAIFNFTLQRVPPLVKDTLAQHGWTPEKVDHYLFHQANAFILNRIAKKLAISPEKVPVNIGKYGNTSMVTIPLLLCDDLRESLLGSHPVHAVMAGFGVGYSWAGAACTLSGLRTAQVVQV